MCFWNIARVWNKCEETWKYLESFDIIGLTETWVKEGIWKNGEINWRQIQMRLYTSKKREEERKSKRKNNNSGQQRIKGSDGKGDK